MIELDTQSILIQKSITSIESKLIQNNFNHLFFQATAKPVVQRGAPPPAPPPRAQVLCIWLHNWVGQQGARALRPRQAGTRQGCRREGAAGRYLEGLLQVAGGLVQRLPGRVSGVAHPLQTVDVLQAAPLLLLFFLPDLGQFLRGDGTVTEGWRWRSKPGSAGLVAAEPSGSQKERRPSLHRSRPGRQRRQGPEGRDPSPSPPPPPGQAVEPVSTPVWPRDADAASGGRGLRGEPPSLQ